MPETCLCRQMRGILTAPIGMQNRATTPSTADRDRGINGLGDHLSTDVISDAVAEHHSGMSVPDRTQEHLTLSTRQVCVGSDRSALSAFRLVDFCGPPSEPAVRVVPATGSPRVHAGMVDSVGLAVQGVGIFVPR